MEIRPSTDSDLKDIKSIQLQAFGKKEGEEIPGLIEDLLDDPTAKPLVSLITLVDEKPVGHILLTKAKVTDQDVSAVILAPLAVIPSAQKQGIGGRLIERGVEMLEESGVQLVFVLGYPKYYTRHSFEPAFPGFGSASFHLRQSICPMRIGSRLAMATAASCHSA